MASSKKKSAPTYSAAADELDAILAEIESGSADVDELATKVERASELMHICRDKLTTTEVRVHKIIESLNEPAGTEAAGTEPTATKSAAGAGTDADESAPPWDEA